MTLNTELPIAESSGLTRPSMVGPMLEPPLRISDLVTLATTMVFLAGPSTEK